MVTGFAFSGGRTTAPLAAGVAGAADDDGEEVAAALGVASALGVSLGDAAVASFGDGDGVAIELASTNADLGNGDTDGDGLATVVGAGVWPKIVSVWAVRAKSNSKRTLFIIGNPRAPNPSWVNKEELPAKAIR